MSTTRGKPQLSHMQRYAVEQARKALEDSRADKAMDHPAEHLSALEYRLENLLAIVDELTAQPQTSPGPEWSQPAPHPGGS